MHCGVRQVCWRGGSRGAGERFHRGWWFCEGDGLRYQEKLGVRVEREVVISGGEKGTAFRTGSDVELEPLDSENLAESRCASVGRFRWCGKFHLRRELLEAGDGSLRDAAWIAHLPYHRYGELGIGRGCESGEYE